jgi:hypothetical protein
MENRYYVLDIKITSKDTEDRKLTPYNDLTTAQRKYHEALTGIGAGSKRICVALLDTYLNTIQREVWMEPEPEPEPEVEPEPEESEEGSPE